MHTEITEEIEEYCLAHSIQEDNLLYQLFRETNLKVMNPRMLSGHLQGRLLSFIARLMHPQYILEIGTYTGYASLCLAEGLIPNGYLHTIEINEELETIIQKYVSQSPLRDKIILHIGDAKQIIPTLHEIWDLVFMDADKEDYIDYFELVFPRMRKGGIILADNVLWNGKVIEPLKSNDKDTQSLIRFNNYIQQDKRVQNFLLPIRDGLMVIEKL